MKNYLIALLVVAGILSGCQKDTGLDVNIVPSDLTNVNSQLKGIWVYPIALNKIVEAASGAIESIKYGVQPAFQFDGGNHVNILQDSKTIIKGTYSLSSKNGDIYIDIIYPSGSDTQFKILSADGATLKLESAVPYIATGNTLPTATRQLISDLTLSKQTAADISGKLVRVLVINEKVYYSVAVSVKHTALPKPADSTVLLNAKLNTIGSYQYEFAARSGDQLNLDIIGDYSQTIFYAYYRGVPLAGLVGHDFQELKTTTGWIVP